MSVPEWLILEGVHYRRTEDIPDEPPWLHVDRAARAGDFRESYPLPQLRGALAIREAEIAKLRADARNLAELREALDWIRHQCGAATCDDAVRVMNEAYDAAVRALDLAPSSPAPVSSTEGSQR